MSQQVKVSIARKDLYYKDYNSIYVEGNIYNSVKEVKNGLVEVMVKIIKELN